MFSLDSGDTVNKIKQGYLDIEKVIQPKKKTGSGEISSIGLLSFINETLAQLNSLDNTESIPLDFTIQGQNYQFRLGKLNLIQMILNLTESTNQDTNWLPSEEYKKISAESYSMFTFMIDSIKEMIELQKKLGHIYTKMDVGMNGMKYATIMPVDDAISFLNSIPRPSDENSNL
jgi:hypothetical protein